MSDERLRELERAADETPGDKLAQGRFAHELARTGSRARALEWLVSHGAADDPLAGALWPGVLGSFEPTITVPLDGRPGTWRLDPSGRLLAWVDAGMRPRRGVPHGPTQLSVADLARGGERHDLGVSTWGWIVVSRGRILALDENAGLLVRVSAGSTALEIERVSFRAPGFHLAGASPAGDRLLFKSSDRASVRAWPSLESILELPANHVYADWESSAVLVLESTAHSPAGRVRAVSLDGQELGEIALGERHRFASVLAPGVFLVDTLEELHVRSLRWRDPIRFERGYGANLSGDRRRLRVQRTYGPQVHVVDLDSGAKRSTLQGVPRNTADDAGWHPHADVAFATTSNDSRRRVLRPLEGAGWLDLPLDMNARAWTEDGLGLLVERSKDCRLELWRPRG